jgi:uncharacterized protein (TIGR02757 family)
MKSVLSMHTEKTKNLLDKLVKKYETPEFIPHDPIKFPHMFTEPKDQEIAGIIASSIAYGKREKILEGVEKILGIMGFKPYEFTINFDLKKDYKVFDGFIYRYNSGNDIALLVYSLNNLLKEHGSLKNAFLEGFSPDDKNIKPALTSFIKDLRMPVYCENNIKGVCFLLPSPENGSACKRLNMFLRWMVRSGPVDLGLWKEIPTSKLIIPVDTHVARVSRKLELTSRKADDWKTAEEITDNLKQFDPDDPAKYDFAIFGMGVSGEDVF